MNARRISCISCALLLIAGKSWSQPYTILTVGGGAPPPTPAVAVTSAIGNPEGTAVDAAHNLYFTSLNCVFKVDTNGLLTVVAGTSRPGYSGDGGAATSAQLFAPNGVAVDAQGNVFFADVGNFRIRKVSNGVITTVAGGGPAFPGDGGPATNASLYAPNGVAVDGQGNLFIADSNNNRIRKVSASGIITTVAGSGTAGYTGDGGAAVNAELSQPQYVALDGSGNIFIADTGNNSVRKVSSGGIISTLAGTGAAGYSGDGGPAAKAQLQNPQGLAVDASGNVFIVDSDNERIRKVSALGVITTVAGGGGNGSSGDGGPATSAQLSGSYGLAVDAAGDLFIGDYYSDSIREVSAKGIINTVAGTGAIFSGDNGPATNAQFTDVSGVAADGLGNLFIADNSRLREVAGSGIVTTFAGNGTCCGSASGVPATGTQVSPDRVAVDGSGNIFIADFFAAIRKVAANGVIVTVAGNGSGGFAGDGGPATSAQLANAPGGLAFDSSGNLFIADTGNNRIRKVSSGGIITTVAGNGAAGFAGDGGPATAAQLSQPRAVAVDASGNLYIADTGNNAIRKVSATGTITTLTGSTAGFSGDGGPAAGAQLRSPQGIAVDGKGNIFIADTVNLRIREISGGIITTIAGNGSSGYAGDCGPATSAQLNYPGDVAVDGLGNLYIADSSNFAVRKLQLSSSTLVCSAVDAASESVTAVSPGKIVVIYGAGLGPATIAVNAPANGVFGTQVAGTTVSFNGFAAPIYYTVAGQVSAIVPYEITGSTVQVSVHFQGQTSSFTVPVVSASPAIFTANSTGIGQAAAVNVADGSLNSAGSPVKTGGYIALFATGEGQTSPAGIDGKLAPLTLPLPAPLQQVTATVGGFPATVVYAGAAPGAVAGLMQVNLLIPAGVQPSSQVPVFLQVGTAVSSPGVSIAVSGN